MVVGSTGSTSQRPGVIAFGPVIPNVIRDPDFRRNNSEPAQIMEIFQDLVPAFSAQ